VSKKVHWTDWRWSYILHAVPSASVC